MWSCLYCGREEWSCPYPFRALAPGNWTADSHLPCPPRGNRTVARAWRGRGAGYRHFFWLGVARAWRGHFLFPLGGAVKGLALSDRARTLPMAPDRPSGPKLSSHTVNVHVTSTNSGNLGTAAATTPTPASTTTIPTTTTTTPTSVDQPTSPPPPPPPPTPPPPPPPPPLPPSTTNH
eukprot:gene11613-biopygen12424